MRFMVFSFHENARETSLTWMPPTVGDIRPALIYSKPVPEPATGRVL
jgi:hypothetical protein